MGGWRGVVEPWIPNSKGRMWPIRSTPYPYLTRLASFANETRVHDVHGPEHELCMRFLLSGRIQIVCSSIIHVGLTNLKHLADWLPPRRSRKLKSKRRRKLWGGSWSRGVMAPLPPGGHKLIDPLPWATYQQAFTKWGATLVGWKF